MKLDSWKRPVEEEIEVKPEEQMELDFTSECPDTARELGIRWEPRIATPKEVAAWQEALGMLGIFLMFTGPMFLIAIWYLITVL